VTEKLCQDLQELKPQIYLQFREVRKIRHTIIKLTLIMDRKYDSTNMSAKGALECKIL
jgi:hypothetical protein